MIPAALDYVVLVQLPSYFNPALIGALLSFVVILVLSKRGNVSEQEREYRKKIHRTPDADANLSKTKVTLWAPATLIVYGCVMPVLLINYYVIPYQMGAGELLANGSVDLTTGESILALMTAPVYIILGLIVGWVVRKRYKPQS